MSNILKKVMSIGNLSRAASPANLEDDVNTQKSNGEGMKPIPNFAEEGITDHTAILMELLLGPEISVYVGEEQTLITMPIRMLIYHSPVASSILNAQSTHGSTSTLTLPFCDTVAFLQIYCWMYQNKLGIVQYCSRTGVSPGMQDACTLLCRMFDVADSLEITAVRALILEELTAAFALARAAGKTTSLAPSTVIEVWGEDSGEDTVLWALVLEEMSAAFSRNPLPLWEEYDECFKQIDPFRSAVAKAMTDRIMTGSGHSEVGAAVNVVAGEGRWRN